jgi:Fe-S oxidoreductase
MRHLLGFVVIVLLVAFPSCKYFKGGLFGKKADTMVVWQARQDSTRIADSIKLVQDKLLALENEKIEAVRKAEEEKAAWESKFKYNIIVGSFYTPEYAKALAEDYKAKGYQTRIIKMDGSKFELVSAEAHDSFRKAVARLKEFQDTIELEAWMYIKK